MTLKSKAHPRGSQNLEAGVQCSVASSYVLLNSQAGSHMSMVNTVCHKKQPTRSTLHLSFL